MNKGTEPIQAFVPLHLAARDLGVPRAWLKAEAKAGRVPSLKAGPRLLFNVEAVGRALLSRSLGDAGASTTSEPEPKAEAVAGE